MEALMNYLYWQTLGINGFDQVSHFLRIVLLQTDCSAYQNNPDVRLIELCSTGVGPYQPCLLKDGTETVPGLAEGPKKLIHDGKDLCSLEALEGGGAGAGTGTPAAANTDDSRGLGRRRGRGQPEAPPLPGQRDISKPQITLPPQIQELLDRLTRQPDVPTPPGLPNLPGLPGLPQLQRDAAPPDTLLDFLLAP
jgi:hypothetical protein